MTLRDGIAAAKGQVRLYTYFCVRLINILIKKYDSTFEESINYIRYAYIYGSFPVIYIILYKSLNSWIKN